MGLANCKECGKLFNLTTSKVCPDCRKSEEEKFELVKEFLYENPKSTIDAVVEGTGVERELIIKFMRDQRLEETGLELNHSLNCKRCGAQISSGKFCSSCKNKLISEIDQSNKAEEKEKKKKGSEMFLRDRFKRK